MQYLATKRGFPCSKCAIGISQFRDRFCFSCNFWEKVDIREDHECWEWQGKIIWSGYGSCSYNRKPFPTHRMSWILNFGKIPEGLYILHKCDNRTCVNPHHLFLGTHQDNMTDRNLKGRQSRGENNGFSKLTEDQVCKMRLARLQGKTLKSIAKEYKVSFFVTQSAINGNYWKHVTKVPPVTNIDCRRKSCSI